MKKPFILGLSLLVSVTFILVTLLLAKTFTVKIKTTYLRKEPKFYAQTVTSLKTGESVEQIGTENGWIQVKTAKGLVGWIHLSSVVEKKFSLTALAQPLKSDTSAGEVALAAKGFNKQVEESYRAHHPGINFAWVDRMVKIKIPSSQMKIFLQKGRLGEFRRAK
jgi:uncharacterized protein YgiM (DUF1202 family)